jgi:hypothetical protein
MKEGPERGVKMADMMTQEEAIFTAGDKRTRGRHRREAGTLHERRTLESLLKVLKDLSRNKFFGELLIKYESGHIVYIRKTQSIKLLEQRAG